MSKEFDPPIDNIGLAADRSLPVHLAEQVAHEVNEDFEFHHENPSLLVAHLKEMESNPMGIHHRVWLSESSTDRSRWEEYLLHNVIHSKTAIHEDSPLYLNMVDAINRLSFGNFGLNDDAEKYTVKSSIMKRLDIEFRATAGLGPNRLFWLEDERYPSLRDRFIAVVNSSEDNPIEISNAALLSVAYKALDQIKADIDDRIDRQAEHLLKDLKIKELQVQFIFDVAAVFGIEQGGSPEQQHKVAALLARFLMGRKGVFPNI